MQAASRACAQTRQLYLSRLLSRTSSSSHGRHTHWTVQRAQRRCSRGRKQLRGTCRQSACQSNTQQCQPQAAWGAGRAMAATCVPALLLVCLLQTMPAMLAAAGSKLAAALCALLGVGSAPQGLALAAMLPLLPFGRDRSHWRCQAQLVAAAEAPEPAEPSGEEASTSDEETKDDTTNGVGEVGSELGSVQTPASVWLPYTTATPGQRMERGVRLGPARLPIRGRIARQLNMLLRLPDYVRAAVSFRTQQIMLGSTWSKVLAVFVVGLPACVLGGMLYSWASGASATDGFVAAYGALYKIPGVTVIGEKNAATAHLMHVLWMFGTFTFAVVLAVVTEDIVATVLAIRKGNYPVVATNHTLIMNWTSQTVPLLRQIAINNSEQDSMKYPAPVVVMAERDKEQMDEELRSALRNYPLEWHSRTGAPHSMGDLERVAAGQAQNIILLDPACEDAGEKLVATVLGIQAARATTRPRPFLRLTPQTIAVQAPTQQADAQVVESAKSIMSAAAQRLQLTELSSSKDMSVLLAQSAVQPGVASVYCSIVQQTRNGVEFYIKHFPQVTGRTYSEARRMFAQAIMVGYVAKENKVLHINPPDDALLAEGDSVVVLSHTGRFRPVQQAPARPARAFQAGMIERAPVEVVEGHPDPIKQRAKQVVVAWWDDDIGDLLASLDMFAPRRSTVWVVSEEQPAGWPDEKKDLKGAPMMGRCRFRHLKGDPNDPQNLVQAGLPTADAVIIGGVANKEPKEADACTLSAMLIIQDVLVKAPRDPQHPVHLVTSIQRSQTIEVANYLVDRLSKGTVTAEMIQSDELISGMISQVAAEPQMAQLLSQFIYSTAGQEIYLRRASRYLLDGAKKSFAQVAELARTKCESAIGYITKDGQMSLVPRPSDVLAWDMEDRVIVIAEE